MRNVWLAALGIFGLAAQAQAADVRLLNIDLAQDHVNITTGFTGADLPLFGVRQGRGDVVVVMEGPQRESTVRKKERIMGAWINTGWMNFSSVPSYYDYASSAASVSSIMSADWRSGNRVGVEGLEFRPDNTEHVEAKVLEEFEDSLVRIKQKQSLYTAQAQKVVFIDDRFFRVDFHLPANVPRGQYTVRGMLVRDGRVVSEVSRTMTVAQVGFSSDVNKVARSHGFAYGLLCVLVAVMAGFLSDMIGRRH
jgi:uncharacterized protein (TIGR02186 family)